MDYQDTRADEQQVDEKSHVKGVQREHSRFEMQ
jgi:hypothetical protein